MRRDTLPGSATRNLKIVVEGGEVALMTLGITAEETTEIGLIIIGIGTEIETETEEMTLKKTETGTAGLAKDVASLLLRAKVVATMSRTAPLI